jgi:hypothetical protein
MTLSFGTAGDAQLASSTYSVQFLVKLDFADGPIYLTTLPLERTIGGDTYTGVGKGLEVEAIATSEDGRPSAVRLRVGVTSENLLAYTLGQVQNYRGRSAWIWLQPFTPEFVPIGTKELEFRGYMDPVRVTRSAGQDGIVGHIELPLQRAGLARSRNSQGLRDTHAQQQLRYPGDKGFEYLQTLIEQPVTWLSKRFQESML